MFSRLSRCKPFVNGFGYGRQAMLASAPVRAVGERAWPGGAGLALSFCALFFAHGLSIAPLVWIGGLALVAGAASLLWAQAPGPAAAAYLGCLWGLALWCGLSLLWSASPDRSWEYTNRTLAYAGFALLGVLIGPRLERVAAAATLLAALVVVWALLAKCVPALYSDYGRVARLRAPLDEWNMLAAVCAGAVPLALWAARRSRLAGPLLLYVAVVALLLTFSRFGVALACLAAAAWVIREDDRVESLGRLALAGGAGTAVFAVALALDGITSDGQSHGVRVHDGWVFALALLAGAAVVAAGVLLARPLPVERRRTVERGAALLAVAVALAGLAVTIVKSDRIWSEFTNPAAGQVANNAGRLGNLGSGNRWTWWQEAWEGFTGHPLGGTGAGTFQFTDLRLRDSSDVTAAEPHNTPLQFLSETGIVGFLLWLGAAGAALAAGRRTRGPLGIVVAVFFAHAIVNYDWSFLGVCGPFLLLGGVLVSRDAPVAGRRPLLAAGAVVFALACTYSLAAPWLADRAWASATTMAELRQAHSYDPLSTRILSAQAELAGGREAVRFYRDALALEPTNSALWLDLARFYAQARDWTNAYRALLRAYRYDPFGPAGQCGLAQQIRLKVGVRASCLGAGLTPIP